MGELRKIWESLETACKELGLPVPVIKPSGLGENIRIHIGDDFRAGGKDIREGLEAAHLYVWGYRDAMMAADKEPPVDQYQYAYQIAQNIISHPASGDTDRLAKAVLALCAAHALREK